MTMTQQPTDDRELTRLYQDFDAEHLTPLWTQLDELMPLSPTPRAVPFVWKWSTLYPLAQRAGDLVPVGRGGERRAIALANPGLGGHRTCRRPCGRPSSTSGRARPRPNTATARTPFASSSRARACGPSSTVTRWPC